MDAACGRDPPEPGAIGTWLLVFTWKFRQNICGTCLFRTRIISRRALTHFIRDRSFTTMTTRLRMSIDRCDVLTKELMAKGNIILLGLLLLFLGSTQSNAQPKLPYFDWGAGPCEYCLYGDWTATKDTRLYKRRSESSNVVFAVKPQEKLTAITGVVITTKAGEGKALKNTFLRRYNKRTDTYSDVKIKRNERFYFLNYQGENIYAVWFKGQILEADLYNQHLLKLNDPKFVWWVKIKNGKGQIGWTREIRNFEGPHEV